MVTEQMRDRHLRMIFIAQLIVIRTCSCAGPSQVNGRQVLDERHKTYIESLVCDYACMFEDYVPRITGTTKSEESSPHVRGAL